MTILSNSAVYVVTSEGAAMQFASIHSSCLGDCYALEVLFEAPIPNHGLKLLSRLLGFYLPGAYALTKLSFYQHSGA